MTTIDEMRKKGGTPEEFKKACGDALVQGFITLDEAEAASEKYRMEWDLVQVRSEARWLRVENERLADGFGTLAARCAKLEKEVKDHAEWARRVATDPEFVPAREIIKELAAVENEVKRLIDQEIAIEALKAEVKHLTEENRRLEEYLKAVRTGHDLGPLIGANTIIDQEIKIKSLEAEAKRLGKENADLKVCLEGANQVVLSSAREAEALATKVEELQSARERDGSEMRETLKFEANLQKTIAQVRLNAGKERDEALAKAKALRRANDTKASAE
jgi:hypothetical protein